MQKRKVCVVIASRANYGRIKSFLMAARERSDLELQIIVSASALLERFGSAIDVIRSDGFEPNATVYVVIEGENPTTMAKSTGLAIVELSTIFENLAPDVVLTVADRYETIASAIAARYMNIPLAHTQGGEISGSIDESVRHSITKLANIHFPATAQAAENIIRMGEDPKTVFHTGCPALDIVNEIDLALPDIDARYGGAGVKIDWNKPYLLVIQHPVTTEFGNGLNQIRETILAVHETQMQAVWLWPNVDAGSDDIVKGIRVFRETQSPDLIHFYRNFSPEDYVRVLSNSACIIGNSSSGIREAALLGVPCVNIGSRQNMRERGHNVVDCGYESAAIMQAIKSQIAHGKYEPDRRFGDGGAGRKMAEILATEPLSVDKTLHYVVEADGAKAGA